jgi:hypothetical protein
MNASETPMPSLRQSGHFEDFRCGLYLPTSVLCYLTLNYNKKYVDPQEIEDLQYACFLDIVRAGLLALGYWDPVAKKHGQAHMQSRYDHFPFASTFTHLIHLSIGITLHLIKEGVVWLEEIKGTDGKLQNLYIRVSNSSIFLACLALWGKDALLGWNVVQKCRAFWRMKTFLDHVPLKESVHCPRCKLTFCQVDRATMLSRGKAATGKLLVELQVRKSTADGAGAREFFTNLTRPPPEWEDEIRDLVLKKKQVRGCLVLAEGKDLS